MEGGTEEVRGKRERTGVEKCKGKELTRWWNWNLLKTKEAWLRPFVFVPFLLFLPLFSPATCSPTNICTSISFHSCRLADGTLHVFFSCPHLLLFRQHFLSKWLEGRSTSRRIQTLNIWLPFSKVLKQSYGRWSSSKHWKNFQKSRLSRWQQPCGLESPAMNHPQQKLFIHSLVVTKIRRPVLVYLSLAQKMGGGEGKAVLANLTVFSFLDLGVH